MIIAVDFDGTLAEYHGFKGVGVYGPPVEAMVKRVHKWIEEGHTIVIFTARVWNVENEPGEFYAIREWLRDHSIVSIDGKDLHITSVKHPSFDEIWDDRAVAVETNTGRHKRFTSLRK